MEPRTDDPPADAPIASLERPPLEWYAEYVQSSTSQSSMVRLSGHRATFDETRAALEELGFALDDVATLDRVDLVDIGIRMSSASKVRGAG